jgi:hypothetical protein
VFIGVGSLLGPFCLGEPLPQIQDRIMQSLVSLGLGQALLEGLGPFVVAESPLVGNLLVHYSARMFPEHRLTSLSGVGRVAASREPFVLAASVDRLL